MAAITVAAVGTGMTMAAASGGGDTVTGGGKFGGTSSRARRSWS